MTRFDDKKYQDKDGGFSQVRYNLLNHKDYKPYCGNSKCPARMPRTKFNGKQFTCTCGFETNFEPEFIVQVIAFNDSLKHLTGHMMREAVEKCMPIAQGLSLAQLEAVLYRAYPIFTKDR